VFVGLPASGKSTFAERYFVPEGYVRINQVHRLCAYMGRLGREHSRGRGLVCAHHQDTLKNKDRCVRACAQALDEGSSVVIDNTNPSPAVRAEYLALAKVPSKCLLCGLAQCRSDLCFLSVRVYVPHAQKRSLPARCFYFATPKDVAMHLNHFREVRAGSAALKHAREPT
jgi:bifunctional polynucleotide phosphatase/kinase